MLRSIGLTLIDTSSKDLENQLEHDTDFHFCWYVDLYPLSFFFPLKMTKLRIRHNQCSAWMTMMTMAPESGISEDNSFP